MDALLYLLPVNHFWKYIRASSMLSLLRIFCISKYFHTASENTHKLSCGNILLKSMFQNIILTQNYVQEHNFEHRIFPQLSLCVFSDAVPKYFDIKIFLVMITLTWHLYISRNYLQVTNITMPLLICLFNHRFKLLL